ncbi:disease resistance protein At4g27190-like [Ziziphus jujuba]|uniref:Disease resistance protein At4g27190-like n=1 Tax=Ziziphus jujuba TaxID=326968 RepID=A0ABM4A3Z8_ZIZJJ|nr:disease resistance protein At4g27190-like [Ziziphus jujuba]
MENLKKVAQEVINYEGIDEKMKKLKRKCDHLKSREEDVKAELEYAEGLLLKKRRKVVENWLANAASIANEVEVEMMEQQVLESSWRFSNLLHEPKIARLTAGVTELIRQGQGIPSRGNGALSPEIEPIAKSLTGKCSGLPLAIKTVAGSMRGVEDISEWRDALEKLKEPAAEHDDDIGIECFLYCSLFPEDYQIDRETLIEHFIDEGFVDGLRSRQAELDRGHTVLNKLENVCLLEAVISKDDGKKYVEMHDLVRSMAIQIGRDKFQFLVEAGEQLREKAGEEKWAEDLKKVSLMDNLLSHIPSSISPKCLRLTTLMLSENFFLKIIPDCFFSHMPQLRVLDLSRTGIINLPTSISELVNLIALWLEWCGKLEYVPSLENLKALRRLNLRGTAITEVHHGLDMLLNLRYLNLEETAIEEIPDGILSKLSCLQYLAIYSPLRVRGEEIVKLSKLETFKGFLYDMNDFNTYVRRRE